MSVPNALASRPPETVIRVAIIEDQRATREGLSFLIDQTRGYRCVGAYGSVARALAAIGSAPPDIVLTDIELPGLSGLEAIKRLHAMFPELPVVALTVHDEDDLVFQALCAGAAGYLLKTTPPARLIDGLRDVIDGGASISPEIARRMIAVFSRVAPPASASCRLTPRELALLKLLVEGHSYKTAAAALDNSVHTIGFHVRNLYRKLEVHSKSEAVVKAMRSGLL